MSPWAMYIISQATVKIIGWLASSNAIVIN